MPSADGHGQARRKLLSFVSNLLAEGNEEARKRGTDPRGEPDETIAPEAVDELAEMITPYARWNIPGFNTELVGFWVLWQAEGGFEGLRNLGMSEATIWRRVRAFRDAFGQHPDDFVMPGVVVDLDAYWKHPDGHGFIGNPAGPAVNP